MLLHWRLFAFKDLTEVVSKHVLHDGRVQCPSTDNASALAAEAGACQDHQGVQDQCMARACRLPGNRVNQDPFGEEIACGTA